jgi:hypothetical protein
MENSPRKKQITYPSIRIGIGSRGAPQKSQMTQEQYEGTSHRKLGINKGKETILEHFHTPEV